jgi:hypothetical protein
MWSARARRQAATAIRRASTVCAPGSYGRPPTSPRSGAHRPELLDHGGLEVGELVSILLRQRHVLLRAQAVLERIMRRTRLALFGFRPARLCAVLAARLGAGMADGNGRARPGACTGHGGIPLAGESRSWFVRGAGRREEWTRRPAQPGLLYAIVGILSREPRRPAFLARRRGYSALVVNGLLTFLR